MIDFFQKLIGRLAEQVFTWLGQGSATRRQEQKGGANIPKRFGKDVPRIIGLQQRHCPFDFLFRNLANYILREMTLKLAIGSHSIVDAIEQKENHIPDQRTAAKTEKQTL